MPVEQIVTQIDKDNIEITETEPITTSYNRQKQESLLRIQILRRNEAIAKIVEIENILSNFK